jgi:hypothetical protein
MQSLQSINRKSAILDTMIVVAAIILGASGATGALAAGSGAGGAGAGGHGGGHMAGGSSGASPNATPSIPPPIFNPSTPYTVTQSPETPVSPR